MSKCETCEELNKEKEQATIVEIKIEGWYYLWCCDILHCPTCGKKITHSGKRIKRKTKGKVKEERK